MKNDNHLWKDIGLHNEIQSPDSSFKAGPKPQIKGYKLEFDNFSQSEQHSQDIIRIHNVESINSSENHDYLTNNQPLQIVPSNLQEKKIAEEQVIEAISFQSESQKKLMQSRQILETLKDDGLHKVAANLRKSMQVSQLKRMKTEVQKNIFLKQKIQIVIEDVLQLKMQIEQYKMYLLDALSHWQVTALQDCQNMKAYINRQFDDLADHREKIKEENIKNSLQVSPKTSEVYKQLDIMKANLQAEILKGDKYKQQIYQLQAKIAKQTSSIDVKVQNTEEQINLNISFLRQQLIRVEKERDDLNLQKEQSVRQLLKTKDTLRDKQHEIQLLNEENEHLLKQISELKRQVEQYGSRQRKLEMKIQLQIQQSQMETSHKEKQLNKHKQEIVKFRELLKNSQQQLRQCEAYITSVKNKSKLNEENTQKLNNKLKEQQMSYYKKLQKFDKILIEVEKSVQEMTKNQGLKLQQVKNREGELEKIRAQLQNREFQLKQKEYEIEELKKQLRHQMYMLERREEGMRAEYKMAVEAQNATKDKWYQRYYKLTSEQEDSSKYNSSSPFIKDSEIPNYLNFNRSSYKKPSINVAPVRQKTSPCKTVLTKAKSQQNLYLGSPKRLQTSRKTDFIVSECYKDNSITSRINNLRAQLSKQLNQINTR